MPRIDPISELAPLKLTLGSQWWSIRSETYIKSMQLVVSNSKIQKYFRKIECSDESYFGTLFRTQSDNSLCRGTTYVEWGHNGGPKVLKFEELFEVNSIQNFLFFRNVKASDIGSGWDMDPSNSV